MVSDTTSEKLKVLKFALHFSRKLSRSRQLEDVPAVWPDLSSLCTSSPFVIRPFWNRFMKHSFKRQMLSYPCYPRWTSFPNSCSRRQCSTFLTCGLLGIVLSFSFTRPGPEGPDWGQKVKIRQKWWGQMQVKNWSYVGTTELGSGTSWASGIFGDRVSNKGLWQEGERPDMVGETRTCQAILMPHNWDL